MKQHQGSTQDQFGNAIPALIQVNQIGTGTPATIYADNNLTPKANPFFADANGEYAFYAANGRYAIVTTHGGASDVQSDVLLYDPTTVAGAVSAGLFAGIAAAAWGSEPVPSSIQIAGYNQVGIGAATWYKLPNHGPGAYVAKKYRVMDADGNWWALPRRQRVTQMQLGAWGNANLLGATKTGSGGFVGSGVTGGSPVGTDDSDVFTDLLDGYLKVVEFEAKPHIIGNVRVASYSKLRGSAAAGYTGNAQGIGYDAILGVDQYLERGIPYFYVKLGAQAAFNVANNTAADQAALIDPITYGYAIDIEGIAIDAWTDNTSSAEGRSCFSAGSVRMRLTNCHLIRGTYAIGGAAAGGSIYTHSLQTNNVTIATCWRGIGNCIDSFYTQTQIANCYVTGFFGTNGSNACAWTGGRIEFTQAGRNIELQSSAHCTFDSSLCDRAWLAGARLTLCTRVTFGPTWAWNRCGGGQVGLDDDECNLFRQGCFKCDDWGSHARGAADYDGTTTPGHFSPKHAVTYNQTNTNCADRGNHSTGFANFFPVTETGTALGGSATSITLAANASAEGGYYNDDVITITAGTGAGQTGTVTGYRGGVAQISGGWSGGIAPDATSVYSIPTGAASLGTTGPILYMSGRNSTQMPGHLVDAVGSERYDNGRTLQEANGDRFYCNPFSAIMNPAGGTDTLSMTMVGPATNFTIQGLKLKLVVRDSDSPSSSWIGECPFWIRQESGSPVFASGQFTSEVGPAGYTGFGSGVFTTGTCQAGSTATTVVLAAGASATTDGFVGATITLTGGTGSGQTNVFTGYNGTSKTGLMKRPWATTPDNTSTYSISFGSALQLAATSVALAPHPTDPFMQIATFSLGLTNRHATNHLRVFSKVTPQ